MIDTTEQGIKAQAEKTLKKKEEEDRIVAVLTLVGVIRFLNFGNKKIALHWLDCLVKGDEYFEKKGKSILQKQNEEKCQVRTPLLEILNLLQVHQKASRDSAKHLAETPEEKE